MVRLRLAGTLMAPAGNGRVMDGHRVRNRGIRALAAAVGAVVALAAFCASPGAAQDGDPYGGTTTTGGGPTPAATCELSMTSGDAGASVTATVRNVQFGETVRMLFGGTEVARATAPLQSQSVGAPVLLGGQVLAQQATRATVSVDFVVPDVEPGSYLVTAVGVDFTAECTFEGGGFDVVDVLGDAVTRGGGRSLARTGMYVLLLLVIGAALVLVGRALLEESRRRRDVERDARRAANHLNRREHTHPPVSK